MNKLMCAAAVALAATATEGTAEDRLEDIADIAKIRMRSAPTAAVLEGSVAEAVISGALLRVLEHIVGGADGLEARFRLGIARIAIRVPLHGKLAIGRFDRRVIRAAINTQQFVKVGFG